MKCTRVTFYVILDCVDTDIKEDRNMYLYIFLVLIEKNSIKNGDFGELLLFKHNV